MRDVDGAASRGVGARRLAVRDDVVLRGGDEEVVGVGLWMTEHMVLKGGDLRSRDITVSCHQGARGPSRCSSAVKGIRGDRGRSHHHGAHLLSSKVPHGDLPFSEGEEEVVLIKKDEGRRCEELGLGDADDLVRVHLLTASATKG